MTTLICSGTLFSDWRNILRKLISTDSSRISAYVEISALNKEICGQQISDSDELDWKPFTPDNKYINKASQLLSSVGSESLFVWDDNDSSLYLDFWKTAAKNAKFVLFYSSPEFELSNYINSHPFESTHIEKVISAWLVRTRALLTFFMKTRNKCLLIDVQSAIRNPSKLIRTINKVFDAGLVEAGTNSNIFSKGSVLHEYFAATLLADNGEVSELFDEVRSTATLLDEDNLVLRDIQARTELLIPGFLKKIDQQVQFQNDLTLASDKLVMMGLQLHQTQIELEIYYLKERDTAVLNEKYVKFLTQDPLLKLARLARLNEPSE